MVNTSNVVLPQKSRQLTTHIGRHDLRESWRLRLPDFPEDHVDELPRWRNFQAYGARLLRDDILNTTYLVWSRLGDLRFGFGDEGTNIVCDWLDIAGDKLLLQKGWDEEPEQWDLWAEKLEEASESPKFCAAKTRARAAKAARYIKNRRTTA